jgi:hypothetical protein
MKFHVLLPLALLLVIQPSVSQQPSPTTTSSLDFEYFKTRVQPIFTAKRPGHARCVSCHSVGTTMRLQPIAQGTRHGARRNRGRITMRSA